MSITVTFEPCPEYVAEHHDAICEECGWLAADHDTAAAAPVIPLPRRGRSRPAPLRRAS